MIGINIILLTILGIMAVIFVVCGIRRHPRTKPKSVPCQVGTKTYAKVGNFKVEVIQETAGTRIGCCPTECFDTLEEAREIGGQRLKQWLADGDRIFKADAVIVVFQKQACQTCRHPRWVQVGAWNYSGRHPQLVPALKLA